MAEAKKRKRRRKLKKSVRRGCLGSIATIFLFIALSVWECHQSSDENAKIADLPEELQPDSIDNHMKEALQKLVGSPLRIDTSQLAICVYDLQRHCSVYNHHADVLMAPASCMKLLTSISAIHRLGVQHQYESRLYTNGTILKDGTLNGYLLLALDDDPLIEDLSPFAEALSRHGIQRINGDIFYDLVRKDTLRPHPTASLWDIPYHTLPLLMKGEKRVKSEFMSQLSAQGITYRYNPVFSNSWLAGMNDGQGNLQEYRIALNNARNGGEIIYEATHPIMDVICPMMIYSSNVKAESVFYHLNHHLDRWGGGNLESTFSVQHFLRTEMTNVITDGLVINDGSGLSPENRLTARFLVHLLNFAFHDEELREALIEHALATPADPIRQGSLGNRMSSPKFLRKVYCKTGTLTTIGASSLSGYCQGEDGRWYAFSIINADTPVAESRDFQDRLCGILVGHN